MVSVQHDVAAKFLGMEQLSTLCSSTYILMHLEVFPQLTFPILKTPINQIFFAKHFAYVISFITCIY